MSPAIRTIAEWASLVGLTPNTLRYRLRASGVALGAIWRHERWVAVADDVSVMGVTGGGWSAGADVPAGWLDDPDPDAATLTPAQAAARLGVPLRTFERWTRQLRSLGVLPDVDEHKHRWSPARVDAIGRRMGAKTVVDGGDSWCYSGDVKSGSSKN